jgi:hypothetical protein
MTAARHHPLPLPPCRDTSVALSTPSGADKRNKALLQVREVMVRGACDSATNEPWWCYLGRVAVLRRKTDCATRVVQR